LPLRPDTRSDPAESAEQPYSGESKRTSAAGVTDKTRRITPDGRAAYPERDPPRKAERRGRAALVTVWPRKEFAPIDPPIASGTRTLTIDVVRGYVQGRLHEVPPSPSYRLLAPVSFTVSTH